MQDLIKALVKARLSFEHISKNKTNPHYKSKYADLDTILDAVNPALLANGILVVQVTEILDGKPVLVTKLIHESGQSIEGCYPLPEISDPQKLGSAITYARRYALCAILNITADDDDDANIASTQQSRPQQQSRPEKPANPNAITEGQRKRLWAISQAHGLDADGIKAIISEYGFTSSNDITRDKYEAICEHVQSLQPA